jgi:putative cell wall-binding protein
LLPRRFAALAFGVALFLSVLVVPAAASAPASSGVEARLVELINADRAAAGLPALRIDVRLVAVARDWSRVMGSRGDIGHDPQAAQECPAGTTTWGENVGSTDSPDAADALHDAFMRSDSHRAAILNRAFTDVGVGAVAAGGKVWVTERFTAGAPAAVAPAVAGTAALAQALFPARSATHAVLVRDDAFPDALAAGPLAGSGGPVLLTPPGPVTHPVVRAALEATLRPGAPVYLVGGENALPAGIEQELAAAGWAVRRLAGADRVEAAAAVATHLAARNRRPDTVLLATAQDWPDAAAGSAFGARVGAPVLLTYRDTLPPATARALRDLRPRRIVALGGASVISDAVVAAAGAIRVAGSDRQGTAAEIARAVWGRRDAASTPRWTVAPDQGDGWTWALTAAPLAARLDAPLLLASEPLRAGLTDYLSSLGYKRSSHADLAVHGPVSAGAVRQIAALVD